MKSISPKKDPTPDPRCGTYAGYSAHRKRKESPCTPCNEANIARAKKYYLDNKETFATHNKKYNLENQESVRARNKQNYLDNPEAAAIRVRRRKALKFNAPSEPYTTELILQIYGTNCYLCHQPIDLSAPRKTGIPGWERGLQLDHKIPLSRGGTDLISNVLPSDGLCNVSKGDKLLF